MNYTIFTRNQVTPKTRTVPDVNDTTRTILNPGDPPAYPLGSHLVYAPVDLDIYSADPLLRRELLAGQETAMQRLPKFGFEVFLNALVLQARAPLAVVHLPGVKSPLKSAKYGFWTGIWGDVKMVHDLTRAVPPLGLIGQVVQMRRLRV